MIDPFSKQYGIHIVYTVRKIYNLYNSLTFKLANSSMAYLTDQLIGILGIEKMAAAIPSALDGGLRLPKA